MKDGTVRLAVQVVPNASRSEVAGEAEGVLRIRLRAQPIEGRANEELVKLVAGLLRVPKSAVKVVQGQSSRRKMLEVHAPGLDQEHVRQLLLASAG